MEKEELEKEIQRQESILSDAEFNRSLTSYGSKIAMIAVGGGLTLIFGIWSFVMLITFVSVYAVGGASGGATVLAIILAVLLPLLALGIILLCFGISGLRKKKELRYQCDMDIMHAKEKLNHLREEERKMQ